MKFLKFILYLILGLVALICALGFFAKKDFSMNRSIEINTPRALVYEQVSKFSNFKKWSYWSSLDPNAVTTIEGVDGTVGATYTWSGNNKIGKGSEQIKSMSPDKIEHQLRFIEPFKTEAEVNYELSGDNPTKIVWNYHSKMPFPWNAAAMFMDMDKNLGGDFEKGLANLKKAAEGEWEKIKRYKDAVKEEDVPVRSFAGLRKTVPFAEMPAFYTKNFEMLLGKATANSLTTTSAPAGLFWVYDEKKGVADMAAAVAMNKKAPLGDGIEWFDLGGKALVIDYFGPYEGSGYAHMAMDSYMNEKGMKNYAPVIEEYVTDSSIEKDTAKWLTKVIYFLQPAPEKPK